MRQTRPWVDVAKLFFALCVVLLHAGVTKLLPFADLIGDCIISLAVPYFFVASGFFLAEKVHAAQSRVDGRRIISAYCRRLGVKLLIFEPVSILLWAAKRLLEGMSLPHVALTTIQDALFYPRGALWYIQAVILAALLLTPLLLRGAETRVIPVAVGLYIVTLLGTRYRFLSAGTLAGDVFEAYDRFFLSLRNGLFVGFPFMLCGCLVSRWKAWLVTAGARATSCLIAVTTVAFGLLTLESRILHPFPTHDGDLFLSYLLVAPMLFALTAQLPGRGWDTSLLRGLSTAVYLVHHPLLMVLRLAIGSPWMACAVALTLMAATLIPICIRRIRPMYDWLT